MSEVRGFTSARQTGPDNITPFDGYFADEEDSEDRYEETVLEYARDEGLCIPYDTELTPTRHIIPALDYDLDSDLQDPKSLSLADLIPAYVLKERLTLSKEDAVFLKLICTQPKLPIAQDSTDQDTTFDDRRRAMRLKLELPLLRTDNDADFRKFGNIAIPKFEDLKLPLERVDESKDEGLTWLPRFFSLPLEKHLEAEKEKLQISKDDLLFLQTAVKDSHTAENWEAVKAEASQLKRNPALEPMTPPLLPCTPPIDVFALDSPAGHIELLSEITNSTAAEGQALDEHIMKNDSIIPPPAQTDSEDSDSLLPTNTHIGQIYSPLRDISNLPSSSPRKRKATDLKIERPLTPPMTLESPNKKFKSVSFAEVVPDFELPSALDSGNDLLGSQNSVDCFFDEAFAPLATEADKRLENEQLKEADSITRTDVPDISFALPQAPWLEFQRKAKGALANDEADLASQVQLLKLIQRDELQDFSSWHGVRRLERELQWSPFPIRLGAVALDEEIQDDAFLTALLEELSEESDSSSLTWKREGLRILDCTEDGEEEIDAGTFPIEKNMESLLRKRRLEMAEDDELTTDLLDNTIRVAQGWLSGTARAPAATKLNMIVAEGRKSREQDQSLMFSGLFSASMALDKYMEMHGKAPKKVKTAESQPDLIPPSVKVTAPEVPYPTDKSTVDPKPIRKTSSLPPLPGRLPPCSFIISATLLTQRHLIRTLQQVYPEVEMIERDFDAPHSPAKEADIILSPSTGLILTTLQKIKQRALPGQPDRSSIKARILVLSNRYEQLVVYVSEGLSVEREKEGLEHPLNELDEYDNKALAELKHFSSSMEAVVSIKYVPGGDEALASWIVWAMNHWGISTIPDRPPKMELLQEETMWELFLRRSGVNAYAAQAILASLKPPSSTDMESTSESNSGEPQVFGLPAFILLAAEERVERFQVLLGGNRILNRASALLDQRWPSAVTGWRLEDSSDNAR